MNFFEKLALYIPANVRDSLPHWLQQTIKRWFQRRALFDWYYNGKPSPPPHLVKVSRILQFQKTYGISTFVETGTYMGDMLAAVSDAFATIHSIELSEFYYKRAQAIFKHKPHITLHFGDSGTVLKEITGQLRQPAIFWLDAHYSGGKTAGAEMDVPLFRELSHLFTHPYKNIILIDDARLFTGIEGYPTLEALNKFVAKHSNYRAYVHNDCILLR